MRKSTKEEKRQEIIKKGFTKELLLNYKEKGISSTEIAKIHKKDPSTILHYMKLHDIKPLGNSFFQRKNNPAKRQEVKERISNSVKKLWEEGSYDNRINGMFHCIGRNHPNFNPKIKFKFLYRKYALKYHDKKCMICGTLDRKIDIHHLDENKKNNLLTNLVPLCNVCHQLFHFERYKQPFVQIAKDFKFDSAHNLLNYEGKCKNLHGHQYFLTIFCKGRISKETSMVLDYGILKDIVNTYIINKLDHNYLNEVLKFNTTAENMLIWIWDVLEKQGFLKGLIKIVLKETDTSYAILTKEDMLLYRYENWEEEIGEFIK